MEPNAQPILTTDRLILRPFEDTDAAAVQDLAGAREIAAMIPNIPHPYQDGAAQNWISTAKERLKRYAITLKEDARLIGSITLNMASEHDHAQLGFWIGVPYWGKGYATEAAREVVRAGFEVWGLHRIYAQYFATNPASGRVLQKLRFRQEGLMRRHVKHWDQYQDLHVCAILCDEYSHR